MLSTATLNNLFISMYSNFQVLSIFWTHTTNKMEKVGPNQSFSISLRLSSIYSPVSDTVKVVCSLLLSTFYLFNNSSFGLTVSDSALNMIEWQKHIKAPTV